MKNLRGAGSPPQISTEINLGRSFDGGGVVGWCKGPTGSNSGGANEAVAVDPTLHDQYRLLLSSPPLSTFGAHQNHPANNFRPLAIFDPHSTDSYKSSGDMVPYFTNAQWKELERQAMIYKYMISSVPVPPHLLYPSMYAKNGASLELSRCKRTDGKKWRCSRDVAPHQKYCERHLHRGRPRSRKPVEIDGTNAVNNGEGFKKPRIETNPRALLPFDDKLDPIGISTLPYDRRTNGDLGLMIMENDVFSNKGSSVYIPEALYNQDYSHPLQQEEVNRVDHQILPYSDFPLENLAGSWPIDNLNINTNNLNRYSSLPADHEDLSPWLDLSMGTSVGGPTLDQEIGNGGMRNGVEWSGPVCYSQPFGPGGPLAEALGQNPTSPHDSVNGPGTAVSSPSGVIQRTLFPHSDGSVCNSPSELGLLRIK
ncbi:growth-regulating factor [Striga asiatica]|uniref:Growth-regulating factor n=1 Tax=Striga asiatica TaxID=4170 RepID=A0A5A7PLB0_STRAF|nr:growth-regulating factor [Striga asiatica]